MTDGLSGAQYPKPRSTSMTGLLIVHSFLTLQPAPKVALKNMDYSGHFTKFAAI